MQGEADFLIFHPASVIIVIEVKSGIIECKNRRWYQTNQWTMHKKEIFDPLSQANKSKFKIINLLRNELGYRENCIVCHAVWFPSVYFITERLPANYSREIILDKGSLKDPEKDIMKKYTG